MNQKYFFMKLFNNWKILIFNGIISLIFGIMLLVGGGNILKIAVVIMGVLIASISVYIFINEFVSKRKSDTLTLLLSSSFTILSLIMIINPELILDSIFIVVGLIFLVLGVINTLNSLKLKSHIPRKRPMLYSGLSYFLIAILLLVFGEFIESLISVIFGLIITFIGFVLIYFGNELRKDESEML